MSALEEMAPHEVGERLRLARETANMTQATAAEAIGVARTTLVAIEQGRRKARLGEVQALTRHYDTSVNALLRRESVHVDLAPRFRRLLGSDAGADQASSLLASLAMAEVELENLLGVQRVRNYPPERPLLSGDVRIQAEHDAAELRLRLGQGMAPVSNLVALLEMEFGVRIYVRRLPASISGLFAYDEAMGACILLNASHPRERRNQSAAHETAHFIATRHKPEILPSREGENSREERYANAFASALLTPARGVMQRFTDVTAGADTLTRRHIIVLAHYFGVSREALVRRLEELGIAKSGTLEWFRLNGTITNEQARLVLGAQLLSDEAKVDADRPTTLRLNLLAAEVARRSLLSEGQLARLLHLDRLDLRAILDAYDDGGGEPDNAIA